MGQPLIILTMKSIPCPRKDFTQPKGKEAQVSAERGELGSVEGKANPSSAGSSRPQTNTVLTPCHSSLTHKMGIKWLTC